MSSQEKTKAFMEADFLPVTGNHPAPTDYRICTALEYIAYQLGQINKKMDTLNERIFSINR